MTAPEATTAPSRSVTTATRFVKEHGPAVRAIVENLGRAGARLVLVGEDGALGDVMVPDIASGTAVIERVAGLVAADWDAETTAALKIGPAHRRKMAGR